MLRIGLTGGIASGKSTVCGMLRERGCRIVDADQVAHQLILKGQPCYEPVVRAFGPEVLDAAGEIDRKQLGGLVFENLHLLETLNSIVHPSVIRQILGELDIMEQQDSQSTAVVDASLMIESGFYKHFRRLVVVTCTMAQQMNRLMSRNGLSEEAARQRISVQMPLKQKLRYADYIVDNSGSLEETRTQVDALIKKWSATSWTM